MAKNSLFDEQLYQSIHSRVVLLTPSNERKWGRMNCAQMMKHLRKAMQLAFPRDKPLPKPSLLRKLMMPLIKNMVLSEKPYREGLPTAKAMIITDPVDFDTEKTKLLNTLDQFFNQGGEVAAQQIHPLFGKLKPEEWGFSQWKHFDHHLRQFNT
jgi:hypothetical protein